MSAAVIIIGGGGTGAALAHDLTGRGIMVTLVERGELFSGATGRHHGLLHSGARYAVHDPAAAAECLHENQLIRRIAPFAIEQNDGLFVGVDDQDLEYLEPFLEGCARCGIPTRQLDRAEALGLEPELSAEVRLAVQVPDAVIDTYRLPLSFLTQAVARGARVRRFCEVLGFVDGERSISGVRVLDHAREREEVLGADLVVNAAGAWAGEVAALAGLSLPLKPGPGVMVALAGRLTDMVINHLHPAAEADIVVPQRKQTIVGTSLWLADHPDEDHAPPDHGPRMIESTAKLVPAVARARVKATWSASRPLIDDGAEHDAPQQLSRTFSCYDHGARDGRPGLLSVIGGKATTLRAMAEVTADQVCALLGRPEIRSRTAEERLPPPRTYFHDRPGKERGR